MKNLNNDFLNFEVDLKHKSPLDSLKDRMFSSQTPGERKIDNAPAGFTVSSPDENENSGPFQFMVSDSTNEDRDKSEHNDMPETDNAEVDTKQAEESNTPAEAPTEAGKHKLLSRLHLYTTDDNGVDVSKIKKPAYKLESVEEILGLGPKSDVNDNRDGDPEPEAHNSEFGNYISDIDKPEDDSSFYGKNPVRTDTATIRFTPVSSDKIGSPSLSVDTMTQPIDLENEFTEHVNENEAEKQFEKSEFEKYEPVGELETFKDEKAQLRKYALSRRNKLITTSLTGLLCIVLLCFLFPSVTNKILLNTKTYMTVSAVMLGIITLFNADMFSGFLKLVKSGKANSDINASLMTISTLLLSIFSIVKEEDAFPMVFICAFTLFIRSLTKFYTVSGLYDNLKIISGVKPKHATMFISDNSVAMPIANNSIEGDILIASSRPTERVSGFMKYATFKPKSSGKMFIFTVISFGIAAIVAVISGLIKQSIVEAFYISSTILSLTALPVLFFIDTLPLRSASKHLKPKGSMINGFTAAQELNTANAAVVKSSDIFPAGTVRLKTMKILSDNNIDDIILRAASITDALSSPLSVIFKQIAKTNLSYKIPNSDTVKYEERLGISGWVNNKRFFIGNRTLMEAHDIKVPPLEVDRQICEKGFFPVYVSEGGVACALLVVDYKVDETVAKLLKNTTELGITVLVENSDPNISSEMICEYFGLYENTVHVMSNTGLGIHKSSTAKVERCCSGSAFRGNSLNLLRLMTCASRLQKSNTLLTAIYCIAAILGIIYFTYSSLSGNMLLVQKASVLLIFEAAATAVSLMMFLIKRP